MKYLQNLQKRGSVFIISSIFAVALGLTSLSGIAQPTQVSAANPCDKVNVIYCGVTSIDNLKNVYASNKSGHAASPTVKHDYTDLHAIYSYQGISSSLINSMNSSNTKVGNVYKDGHVAVNGKTVGTDAKISARFSVAGAQHIPGTNAYVRDVKSSFRDPYRQAYVRFDQNGKMLYAIEIDCGNGVTAVPVAPPAPPKPQPQQSLVCTKLSFAPTNQRNQYVFTAQSTPSNGATVSGYRYSFGDGNTIVQSTTATVATMNHAYSGPGTYTATVTVNGTANGKSISHTQAACSVSLTIPAQPTPPAPTPTPTPPAPTVLPNAGVGNVLGIFGGTSITGTLLHRFIVRRRLSNIV